MMRTRLYLIGFFLVTFSGLTARAEYTAKEWAVLKTGEVVVSEVFTAKPDGTQVTDVLVKIWIKAPREEVWKVIRDYNHFGEFMPRCQEAKTVQQEGETSWVYYDAEVLMFRVTYHLKVVGVEKYRRIEFAMDRSRKNDIKDAHGYWVLEDAPEGLGSVVSYSATVDPGIPAPEFLARRVSKSSLAQVAKNVRQRVESGGAWKKPEGE